MAPRGKPNGTSTRALQSRRLKEESSDEYVRRSPDAPACCLPDLPVCAACAASRRACRAVLCTLLLTPTLHVTGRGAGTSLHLRQC